MRVTVVVLFIIVFSAVVGYFGYLNLSDIPYLVKNGILLWTMVIGVVLVASLITFIGVTVRYQIPKPNTTLIRTSKSKEKVATDTGLWVNTITHKIREIPLYMMQIDIVGEGVLTHDFRRCDLEVAFYLRIVPDEDDIRKAAQFFNDKPITPETMQMCFEPKLERTLKSVVAQSYTLDITQKRQKFMDQVRDACEDELKSQYGIILEYIDINKVNLKSDDFNKGCTSVCNTH